ncbi:hypothetical protein [Paenibacillus glycanilyticus]|uniref:Uncharacterized protein n=1 Tax=Paenibacillus glycanilyticus TaxID=126569 RepID=A0ABQ6GEG0_9BACL|nr:hypothetical protein [Paenibacillus glycanilyticus]GLX68027.1 hypothetical protein MU1_23720 [Paenibacillus glycanilyticus]
MRTGTVSGATAFARGEIIQSDGDVVHPVILDARVHVYAIIAEI